MSATLFMVVRKVKSIISDLELADPYQEQLVMNALADLVEEDGMTTTWLPKDKIFLADWEHDSSKLVVNMNTGKITVYTLEQPDGIELEPPVSKWDMLYELMSDDVPNAVVLLPPVYP